MTKYVLGSDDQELARLDGQAAAIDAPSRLLMRAAGIGPGMRVLNLGTGIGHVARRGGRPGGRDGQVVGLDNSPRLLEVATAVPGIANLRFVEGDVRTWRDEAPFDAIVGRLILFHLPDAVAVVRHRIAGLRPGGLFLAMDFDVGSARCEPPVPLIERADRPAQGGVPQRRRRPGDRPPARRAPRAGRARLHPDLRHPGLHGARGSARLRRARRGGPVDVPPDVRRGPDDAGGARRGHAPAATRRRGAGDGVRDPAPRRWPGPGDAGPRAQGCCALSRRSGTRGRFRRSPGCRSRRGCCSARGRPGCPSSRRGRP